MACLYLCVLGLLGTFFSIIVEKLKSKRIKPRLSHTEAAESNMTISSLETIEQSSGFAHANVDGDGILSEGTDLVNFTSKTSEKSYGQILNFSNPHPIKDALFLHNQSISNATLDDCSWRPANQKTECPDPDIKFILYADSNKEIVESYKTDWLRQSSWNYTKENILIIHGYAGGDDTLPISVLRDAYIADGNYNVWMLDWGPLSQPPCYSAAVHNMKPVAKCAADFLTSLRAGGLQPERTTCVGHSLGAHICGLISRYVLFRLHRIVALDPARPLVPAGVRLNSGNAAAVHALHTNAGNYGEMGRSGHVDFCINGGRTQPFCENTENEALCSHVWVICYMAESVNTALAKKAEPCSRRCPTGPRPGHRLGIPIFMGQFTPLTSTGSFCVNDDRPPYCPISVGAPGDKRCCL